MPFTFQGLFPGRHEPDRGAEDVRRGFRDHQVTQMDGVERAAEEGVHCAQCAADVVESGGQLRAEAASAGWNRRRVPHTSFSSSPYPMIA